MAYIRVIKGIPYRYRSQRKGKDVVTIYLGRADGCARYEANPAHELREKARVKQAKNAVAKRALDAGVKEEGVGETIRETVTLHTGNAAAGELHYNVVPS